MGKYDFASNQLRKHTSSEQTYIPAARAKICIYDCHSSSQVVKNTIFCLKDFS